MKDEITAMAFVYEKVSEDDKELRLSMGFKNFSGYRSLEYLSGIRSWRADRERNAFLQDIGGEIGDIPFLSIAED